MAITWTDVTNLAPDMAAVPGAAQTAILAYVALQVPAGTWGTLVDLGQIYLAAHLGKLSLQRGAGAVTSESVGALARSYATPPALRASLGLTSYGAEYRRLIGLLPTSVGVVP